MFGVYEQLAEPIETSLLGGIEAAFVTPASRHTEIRELNLPIGRGIRVLAKSVQSGLSLLDERGSSRTYMLNHLEYDANTADNTWRDVSKRFCSNWLRIVASTAGHVPKTALNEVA